MFRAWVCLRGVVLGMDPLAGSVVRDLRASSSDLACCTTSIYVRTSFMGFA